MRRPSIWRSTNLIKGLNSSSQFLPTPLTLLCKSSSFVSYSPQIFCCALFIKNRDNLREDVLGFSPNRRQSSIMYHCFIVIQEVNPSILVQNKLAWMWKFFFIPVSNVTHVFVFCFTKRRWLIRCDLEIVDFSCWCCCWLEPQARTPKGMVLNDSFSHQYAILLCDYGIAFSQAIILGVNNLKE